MLGCDFWSTSSKVACPNVSYHIAALADDWPFGCQSGGMNESVWTWNDLSPEDGCTLVAFAMVAASLTEVAQATPRIPHAQNRTVGKLLANARARKMTGDVADLAQAYPGEIFWRSYGDEASWTALPAPSA
jgi:hypothetical protein